MSTALRGCLWWLLCLLMAGRTAHAALVLPETARAVNLAPHTETLSDTARTVSLQMAREAFEAGAGVPVPGDAFNAGFSEGRVWMHFTLVNASSRARSLFIEIDYPLIDHVDAYCGVAGGQLELNRLGDHVQYASRAVAVRNHVIPLELPAETEARCYLEVASSSNLAVPLTVSDALPYLEWSRLGEWHLGFFYGLAFALMIYNLVLFWAGRERMYLWYALHVLASSAYNSLIDGSLAAPWSALDAQDHALLVFILGSQAASLLFAHEYLACRLRPGWQGVMISVALSLLLAELLAMTFLPVTVIARIVVFTTLLTASLVLALGLGHTGEPRRTILPFLLGFGAVAVMAMGACLACLGWVSSVMLTTYGMKWAWVFELAMLSSALALRVDTRGQPSPPADRVTVPAPLSEPVTGFPFDLTPSLQALTQSLQVTSSPAIVAALDTGLRLLAKSPVPVKNAAVTMQGFDWLALVHACGVLASATRYPLQWRLTVAAGTPVNVIADCEACAWLLCDMFARSFDASRGGRLEVRVGLSDDIHDDRLGVMVTVVSDDTGGSATELPAATRQRLVAIGARMGMVPGAQETRRWLVIPASLPEDVTSTETAQEHYWPPRQETQPLDPVAVAAPHVNVAPVVPASARMMPDVAQLAGRDIKGLRVLLAEDNLINQKVICGFLDRLGITPVIVADGRRALEAIQTAAPAFELVFMDCQMPVMDGIEAVEALRAWEQAQQRAPVAVIGLSAHAGDDYRQQGLQAGMNLYLTKPLTFRGIAEALSRVLHVSV